MNNEFDAPALADTERVALIDESGCLTLLGSDSHSVIPADLSGKVLWEVVHPSDIAAAHRAVREAFTTGARTTIRVRVQDDGGGWHTVDGSVRRLDGEVPPQAMLAVTHVSEGLPIEPRTLDAEEQLRRAGKLEVLGRLAGGISHDFGNLLTIIVNDIGRVLDALPADSGLRAPAESVRAAAERAAGMVETPARLQPSAFAGAGRARRQCAARRRRAPPPPARWRRRLPAHRTWARLVAGSR